MKPNTNEHNNLKKEDPKVNKVMYVRFVLVDKYSAEMFFKLQHIKMTYF